MHFGEGLPLSVAPAGGQGPSRSWASDVCSSSVSFQGQPAGEPLLFPWIPSHKLGSTPWSPQLLSPIESPNSLWSISWTSPIPPSLPHCLSPGPKAARLRWGSPFPSHSHHHPPSLWPSAPPETPWHDVPDHLNSIPVLRAPLQTLPSTASHKGPHAWIPGCVT